MSETRLLVAGTVTAVLGIAISGYLTVIHYAGAAPACGISHGCATVQASQWSSLAGIPVAVLGLAGYLAILVALWLPGEAALLAAAGMSLAGFGFSLYLTYRELFDIHAICQWCVGSLVVMTALTAVCTARAMRAPDRRRTTGSSVTPLPRPTDCAPPRRAA